MSEAAERGGMPTEPTPAPRGTGAGEATAPKARANRGGRRWRGGRLALLLGAVFAGILAAATYTGALWHYFPRHDLDRWQGRWRIAIEERATPNAIRVSGQRWEYEGQEGVRAYRLELDATAEPKRLSLELLDTRGLQGPTPRLHGLYAFEGRNRVRVVLLPQSEPLPLRWEEADHVLTLLRE